MSDVGTGWEMLDSAEEEFLEAVRKQSIGRPCVVRPSVNLASKFTIQYPRFPFLSFFRDFVIRNTRVEDNKIILGLMERRLDGVKPNLRPVLTNDNHVDRGGAPRDPGFFNQTTRRGAATGKAEKKKMMLMAQIPVPTVKSYARPSYTAPSTGWQMNIARTTLTSSVRPLRLQPNENEQQNQKLPKAVAASVAVATPRATSAHHLGPMPLSSPLQDVANRWARAVDAARERRKELKRQFRRDFGIGYCGHY